MGKHMAEGAPTCSQVLVTAVKGHDAHPWLPNSSRCRQHCPAHAVFATTACKQLQASRSSPLPFCGQNLYPLTSPQLTNYKGCMHTKVVAHRPASVSTAAPGVANVLVSRAAFLEGPELSNVATTSELLTKSANGYTLRGLRCGLPCPCPWWSSAVESQLTDAAESGWQSGPSQTHIGEMSAPHRRMPS